MPIILTIIARFVEQLLNMLSTLLFSTLKNMLNEFKHKNYLKKQLQ
jgi:hypothetical protein